MPLTRRACLWAAAAAAAAARAHAAADPLQALERRAGGRLGVALLDTGSGSAWSYRGDERFAMCSTFKLPLVAAVLAQVDAGRWQLDDRLPLRPDDLVGHAPVARRLVTAGGARLDVLAQAAQEQSDNAAANVLLQRLGGPPALTRWLREQGDTVTRLDRPEPIMNQVIAGDDRDTTTPVAMAQTLARLAAGPMLAAASRDRLLGWMRATRTGERRLRAGLPAGWRAGDKTGTGLDAGLPDRINDIAVFWPANAAPAVVVTAYYEGPRRGSREVRAPDQAVLAAVGRLAAGWARALR